MIRFWPTVEGLCYREISLFCKKKTVRKKYHRDRFLRKSTVPGCDQISLESHTSGFTHQSQKRFSMFYSSSEFLSDDISLALKLKTAFNPFWLRLPLWRHNLTFCVQQKLNIIWSTIVVYLGSLVKKWKEM